MPHGQAAQLWETSLSRIQTSSNQRAFLALNLEAPSVSTELDAWVFSGLIHEWMKAEKVSEFFLLLNRQRAEYWTKASTRQNYQEFIRLDVEQTALQGCVWKSSLCSESSLQALVFSEHEAPLEAVAQQQDAALLHSAHPFALDTVQIAKPWGHESWYTGIEERGVAHVHDQWGRTELPYALSLFQNPYLNTPLEDMILLKTLNPVSETTIGDLYLEVHEKKWEVYVVIDVDSQAWPSGVGQVQAGLNADKIKDYQEQHGKHWQKPYLEDFNRHISNYESLRRQIDQVLDTFRTEEEIDLNAALSPTQIKNFLNRIPQDLQQKEKELRQKAHAFVGIHEVKVGDVVTFAPGQMHALQHGVRVIEFQTAHYERLIVMFGQKVLTQTHWDTSQAMAMIEAKTYYPSELKNLEKSEGFHNERFVDFPNFTADRITIQPGGAYSDCTVDQYHLLIGILGEGQLEADPQTTFLLEPEKSVFLPVSLQNYTIHNLSEEPLIYLKAMPK